MADENAASTAEAGNGEGGDSKAAPESKQGGSFFGGAGGEVASAGTDAGNAPKAAEGGKEDVPASEDTPQIPDGYFKAPGEGASAEDIAAYNKAIGVPDTVDGYAKGLPDKYEMPNGLSDALLASGAPASVMKAIAEWDVKSQEAAIKQYEADLKIHRENAVATLKSEWGENSKKNFALMERALTEFGGDAFKAEAKKLGLTENIEFARFAAKVGSQIGEDTLEGGGDGSGGKKSKEPIEKRWYGK